MSVPTLNAKALRAVRWLQVAGLILSTGDLVRGLLFPEYASTNILAAVMVAFWLVLICVQTKLIHRREALERPRPDYSAIAAICSHRNAIPVESVLGDVIAKLCPDCDEQLEAGFTVSAGPVAPASPPQGYGVTMAEFGAGLARFQKDRAKTRALCERGHGDQLWVEGRGQMCPQCDGQRRGSSSNTIHFTSGAANGTTTCGAGGTGTNGLAEGDPEE